MTDQEFQQRILTELIQINGRFDTLEWKVDTLSTTVASHESRFDRIEWKIDTIEWKLDRVSEDLHEFRDNQETFNNAIWNLNNQAFQSINDVRNEVVPTWKTPKSAHNMA